MRLKTDSMGNPVFSTCGKGVRVEDAGGLASWVDARNLPADLPESDRQAVAEVLNARLPLDGLQDATNAPASDELNASGAPPPLDAIQATQGVPAPTTDERPPVISDADLQRLAEAGVQLPPSDRVPEVKTAAERRAEALALEAEAKARLALAKATEAEAKARRADPDAALQWIPADIVPAQVVSVEAELRQRAQVAALMQRAAEGQFAATAAHVQQSALLNAHVANVQEARAERERLDAQQAQRKDGVTTGQLAALGVGGWLLGGMVIGTIMQLCGIPQAACWGLAKIGSVAGAWWLVSRRLAAVRERREAEASDKRRAAFLAHQATRADHAQEAI